MIIIGMGRVGQGLTLTAERVGVAHTRLSRTSDWSVIDPSGSGPILLTVNAGDISGTVGRIPQSRRSDAVLIQNGMIDPTLKSLGIASNTRGLLYFAVPSRGVEPSPGASSPFSGPHAREVTDWLRRVGLQAHEVTPQEFQNEMMSKLIWNCVFGLLCDVHDCSVGALCKDHTEDVRGLISELAQLANIAQGTNLEIEETCESLCSYSMSIADYQGTLKQWVWRNGWFVDAAKNTEFPTPLHRKFLVGRAPTDS